MSKNNLDLNIEKVVVTEIINSIKKAMNTTVSYTGIQGAGKSRIGLDFSWKGLILK